jgi:hypothetical protein
MGILQDKGITAREKRENGGSGMKWDKIETWRYRSDGNFIVEVLRWEDETGKPIWNKYLYLFPGNKHFGKYRPDEDGYYPETPFDFHYGITYYHEVFDKEGKLERQTFGDDYNHAWDQEYPISEFEPLVFQEAEYLIEQVSGATHE